MNIIDTSLWIEFFAGTPLDESIVNAMSNRDELYVPTICLYEVRKKFLNDNDAAKAVTAIDIMKKGMVISIDSEIALLASTRYYAQVYQVTGNKVIFLPVDVDNIVMK